MQLRTLRLGGTRGITSLSNSRRTLRDRRGLLHRPLVLNIHAERQFIGAFTGIARHLLKLRYFVATGVIGGSVAASNVSVATLSRMRSV
ncbi:hypothetical protein ANCDUO_01019 [Ancylostoma duodenale]|uniref:Uncharacterized protein n=1 Tax=Ancylostoma duodenale TaxID=51022 RepID=A0A0C2HGC5_9BILA|nr:hypothetical protein ANCDUO_01019 [Ancylostoma duodenale]